MRQLFVAMFAGLWLLSGCAALRPNPMTPPFPLPPCPSDDVELPDDVVTVLIPSSTQGVTPGVAMTDESWRVMIDWQLGWITCAKARAEVIKSCNGGGGA